MFVRQEFEQKNQENVKGMTTQHRTKNWEFGPGAAVSKCLLFFFFFFHETPHRRATHIVSHLIF